MHLVASIDYIIYSSTLLLHLLLLHSLEPPHSHRCSHWWCARHRKCNWQCTSPRWGDRRVVGITGLGWSLWEVGWASTCCCWWPPRTWCQCKEWWCEWPCHCRMRRRKGGKLGALELSKCANSVHSGQATSGWISKMLTQLNPLWITG